MEPLKKAQWKDHKHASSCHICFKPFKEGNQKETIAVIVVSTEKRYTRYATYSIRYHPTFQSYSITFRDTMLICSLRNWLTADPARV